MYPIHPITTQRLVAIRREALLAEAVDTRRLAQAQRPSDSRPLVATELRRSLGSAVVALGQRLQGAPPADHAAAAPTGRGVPV